MSDNFKSHSYGAFLAIVHALTVAVLLILHTGSAFAAEKLIVAYGDSLMAGYQLKANEGFAPQLEAALRARGHDVRVKNAGVSGDTTAGGHARQAWVLGGLKTKPDLVILELGANDMLRGLDPDIPFKNLDAMMANFKSRGIPVLVAGMYAAPNLGKAYASKFNAIYPALARKYRAPLYPFFMQGVAANKALLLDDGMHPNPKGVAVIVKRIAPSVEKALE